MQLPVNGCNYSGFVYLTKFSRVQVMFRYVTMYNASNSFYTSTMRYDRLTQRPIYYTCAIKVIPKYRLNSTLAKITLHKPL